jgi:hypothetical protein
MGKKKKNIAFQESIWLNGLKMASGIHKLLWSKRKMKFKGQDWEKQWMETF